MSQLCYWGMMKSPDDWFYKTREQLELETGLKPHEQRKMRKLLREKGWIEEKFEGVPPKLYFRMGSNFLKYLAVQGTIAKKYADNREQSSIGSESEPLRVSKRNPSTIYNKNTIQNTTTPDHSTTKILAHIANNASCREEKNAVLRVAESEGIDMNDFGKARVDDSDYPF